MNDLFNFYSGLEKIAQIPLGYKIIAIFLLVLVFLSRRQYIKYLENRLFFAPWINMSNVKALNIGESLSEMLYFELESIQKIHKKSASSKGLWNEKNRLPLFGQAKDGEPALLGKVRFLGISGKFGIVLRLIQIIIFFAQPRILRGSIHKYGQLILLQVILEGTGSSSSSAERSRCWKKEDPNGNISNLPKMISELAHLIYKDLSAYVECKTTESFQSLTLAFREHLEYDNLREEDLARKAIKNYEEAIRADGNNNAMASYNLALVYYSKLEHDANKKAIESFRNALQTSNNFLRAQAYSGLANAFCQSVQRHKVKDDSALIEAVRLANHGYNITQAKGNAAIVKALAYAWQVVQEKEIVIKGSNVIEARDKAIKYYKEAIRLNREYTIAYSNLGYLYLEMAKLVKDEGERLALLSRAEELFKEAIKSDPTFHLAYDNLGNVCKEREEFDKAEAYYFNALDYSPKYLAAHDDLSKLYLHLALSSGALNSREAEADFKKAHGFHLKTLSLIQNDEKRIATCTEFKKAYKAQKGLNLGLIVPPHLSEGLRKENCECLIKV